MTPARRRRINLVLWCALIVGGVVVFAGALAERSGEAPPPATPARRDPTPPRPPKIWDFTADFVGDVDAARNPSADRYGGAGVWRYMAAARPRSRDPSTFALLLRFREGLQGLPGFDAWFGRDDPTVSVSFPIVGVRGAGTTRAQGFVHPSSTRRAIIAWRSPVRARVTVIGTVSDLDPGGGDGVSWALRKGPRTVARGKLDDGGRAQRFRERGVSVRAGDICALVVAAGVDSAFDSTGVTLRIEEQRPQPA
jgi:hypothetical protein